MLAVKPSLEIEIETDAQFPITPHLDTKMVIALHSNNRDHNIFKVLTRSKA